MVRAANRFFSRLMHVSGTCQDHLLALTALLKSFPSNRAPPFLSQAAHARAYRLSLGSHLFTLNSLLNSYFKFRNVTYALKLFDKMPQRNLISWTCAISGCTQNDLPLKALDIFKSMREEEDSSLSPDFVVFISVLSACADIEDLGRGTSVHALVIKTGCDKEMDVVITLTSLYAKCGLVRVARLFFNQVANPPLLLYNAMISGYAKNGSASNALNLFDEMLGRNVRPDSVTLRSAMLACAQLGSLEIVNRLKNFALNCEFKDDIYVNTAIIDMFAKCGSIDHAREVFDLISRKDVVVWSSMINGYASHGRVEEAIVLFEQMIKSGTKPNHVTFVGLLSACNHAGLVDQGWRYFHSMRYYGVTPQHKHYACVVDLLSRAGFVEKAFKFILDMPIQPELTVWGALLNSCKIHGYVDIAKYAANRILSLQTNSAGHYVQLSNIYASARMWGDVTKLRMAMRRKRVSKETGCSTVEMEGEMHGFTAEGLSNEPNYDL